MREKPFKKHKDHVGCNFGMKDFNKIKRTKEYIEELNTGRATTGKGKGKGKGKCKCKNSTTTTTTSSLPPIAQGGVIFIDFDGHTVSGTSWNYNGDIVAAPSGLGEAEKDMIMSSILEDYAPFNVTVTTDENVYLACHPNKRIRCIVTETWEWYGQAGGVAFTNSFTWGDNTPCWVFSSLLGYNTKYIQEAISHEVGHTLGLYHQARYDENCLKISEYNTGCCGEAPIMGIAYYQPIGKWWVGPNTYGCNNIQDDAEILKQKLGLK